MLEALYLETSRHVHLVWAFWGHLKGGGAWAAVFFMGLVFLANIWGTDTPNLFNLGTIPSKR